MTVYLEVAVVVVVGLLFTLLSELLLLPHALMLNATTAQTTVHNILFVIIIVSEVGCQ